ncbi:MAG: hypothetical protein LW834_18100 [Cyanobium sp. 49614_E6]|nr:hypothetical protein [Cyanobium sp. 49614_E6]
MALTLERIEAIAAAQAKLLRIQAPRRLGLWNLRVVVARPRPGQGPLLLGDLKGWAMPTAAGLHLDTLRIQGQETAGVGDLIWAATFAWALQCTPCRRAWLLAIRDRERQHARLVRYFQQRGFAPHRQLGAAVSDLPGRLLWGGSGLLMVGDCQQGLNRCERRLQQSAGPLGPDPQGSGAAAPGRP